MPPSKKGVTEDMIHVEVQVKRKVRNVENGREVLLQKDEIEDVKRKGTKSKKIKGKNQEENISEVDDKSKQDEEVRQTKRTRGKTQEIVKKTMAKNKETVNDQKNFKPSKKTIIRQLRDDDNQSSEEGHKTEKKRKIKTQNLNEDVCDQSEDTEPIKNSKVHKTISKNPDVESQQIEDVRPITRTRGKIQYNIKKDKKINSEMIIQSSEEKNQSEDEPPKEGLKPKRTKRNHQNLHEDDNDQSEDVKPTKKTKTNKAFSKIPDAESQQNEDVKPVSRTRGKIQDVIKKDEKIIKKISEEENQSEDEPQKKGLEPKKAKTKPKTQNLHEDDQSEDMKPIKNSKVNKAIRKNPHVESQQIEDETKCLLIIPKLAKNPNKKQDLMKMDKIEEKNEQVYTRSKSKLDDLKIINAKDCFIPTIPERNKTQKNKHGVHSKNAFDIEVKKFSISYENKKLFVNANLYITYGRRYGLVGPNGCGKTTLINHLAYRMFPLPFNLDIMHFGNCEVQRQLPITELYTKKLKANEKKGTEIQETLNKDKKKSKEITMILKGLGISKETYNISTNNLSKELRMRISLARLLSAQPTLLLLDEPTNCLDSDAIAWLEKYLQRSKNTLIIASHEQSFIDNVCNEIIYIDNLELNYHP